MSNQAIQIQEVDDALSKGEIFEVLQNERRRYTLQYLREQGGPVKLGDLVDHVAAKEYKCDSNDVSSAQRKRVYTTLQQTHLPKLHDAGIVDYDSDSNVITTTPQTQELTVYLEVVSAGEFPWREYYLSLSAVSLAIVTVLWVGVYPFTVLSPLVWATVITVVFLISAVYHTYGAREMTLSEYTGKHHDQSE